VVWVKQRHHLICAGLRLREWTRERDAVRIEVDRATGRELFDLHRRHPRAAGNKPASSESRCWTELVINTSGRPETPPGAISFASVMRKCKGDEEAFCAGASRTRSAFASTLSSVVWGIAAFMSLRHSLFTSSRILALLFL
jgi:hypothetical protein